MAGRRRAQRSVRVVVAATLIALAACGVVIADALSTSVGTAAVLAVVAGAAGGRLLYAEVLQTRRDTTRCRADQALAFGTALSGQRAHYSRRMAEMSVRVIERDRSIAGLHAQLRDARELTQSALSLANQESRRADEAQARLAEVFDAVLVRPVGEGGWDEPGPDEDLDDAIAPARELPTVVDMLTWEERANASRPNRSRRHA
jgi:hypothetical protein